MITSVSALSALAAALVIAGCRNDARSVSEGMTADLERDLQLASAVRPARSQAVSAVELTNNGGPSGRNRGARALVRTPRVAPVESPSTTSSEVAAAGDPAEEMAPLASPTMTETVQAPAPAPVVEPVATAEGHGPYVGTSAGTYGGGSDDGDRDRGRGERGRGRGIPGVIIRGGSPGEDNCRPRGGRTAGGMGGIGPNIGTIGTVIGIMGGISGGNRRSPYPRF